MRMEDCRVGMEVVFGRGNGEQTHGVVVKLNRTKAKVKTLENRGSRSQAGEVWSVPYSLMRPSGVAFMDEMNSLPTQSIPIVPKVPTTCFSPSSPLIGAAENSANVPIPWTMFQDGVEQAILEAINVVYSHLSPESLTCDGEAPKYLVIQKRGKLNNQLRYLFKALGREVSEKVAFDWHMEKMKNTQRNGTNG